MIQKSTEATTTTPLWPCNVGIEVIGLTGDFASGKTLFGLTIAPGKDTLVFDVEKSTATYQSLGFDRIDLPGELLSKFKGAAYKPIDLYMHWLERVRAIKPGQYRVIMLDPVSEIENGLVDWVRDNPKLFGYSASQFAMGGFLWGAVKDYWKSILSDLATRCETFVFTSHLRTVWKGGTPTGQKSAKGKETLMEMASLYLHLERKKDAKGNVPEVPSAIVLKSRLAETLIGEGGKVSIRPYLPPRLQLATPQAIRDYILAPPDYSHLKKGELAPEEVMTEDEKLQLRAATAQAEERTESLRTERLMKATSQATHQAAAIEKAKAEEAKAATTTTTANGKHEPSKPSDPAHPFGDAPKEGQLAELRALKQALAIPDDKWKEALAKRKVSRALELSEKQAAELIIVLRAKLETKRKEAAATTTAGN